MVNVSLKSVLTICSVFLLSSANATSLNLSAEGEALYFKALPYLQRIDEIDNEIFTIRHQLPAGETFPQQKREYYRDKMQALVKHAAPLVSRSAEEGNPAAQYRLAMLLSTFEPLGPSDEKVCGLLRASLSNGFTPAGLQMLAFCFEQVKTPEFRSLVDALPNDETLYGKYYPQPTTLPICESKGRARGPAIVSLDEKGFRANLYMTLATQLSTPPLKQEKLRYLNKAAEYGCASAVQRLKIRSPVSG
ncbi:hypothetical protein PS3A_47890 [Pseudomonas sp. 3A(2025)]